jgi:hypothetical protein
MTGGSGTATFTTDEVILQNTKGRSCGRFSACTAETATNSLLIITSVAESTVIAKFQLKEAHSKHADGVARPA